MQVGVGMGESVDWGVSRMMTRGHAARLTVAVREEMAYNDWLDSSEVYPYGRKAERHQVDETRIPKLAINRYKGTPIHKTDHF